MIRELFVYTDGSFSAEFKISSIAFLYFYKDNPEEVCFFSASRKDLPETDNNIIETIAIIEALRHTKNISEKITLFTDSQISIEKIMSVESDRNPIYKKAFSYINNDINLLWKKGHSKKNYYNTIADLLCKLSRFEMLKENLCNNEYLIKQKILNVENVKDLLNKDKKMQSFLLRDLSNIDNYQI